MFNKEFKHAFYEAIIPKNIFSNKKKSSQVSIVFQDKNYNTKKFLCVREKNLYHLYEVINNVDYLTRKHLKINEHRFTGININTIINYLSFNLDKQYNTFFMFEK